MSAENSFLEQLAGLKDLGALQGGYVTREQIQESFPEFTQSQQELLTEYLTKNHIGIDAPLDDAAFLSDEENHYLAMYLEELEELEDVTEQLRRILIMNTLNGDLSAKKKLTESYLKSVVDIAKLYTGQGALVSDLIGEGNVALALAVDMLECVETPEDVHALIVKNIMNAMEEYIGIESDESKKEEKALEIVVKVTDKAKEMSEELLRKVTIEELSGESGISEKKIREAIRISKECLNYIEEEKTEA